MIKKIFTIFVTLLPVCYLNFSLASNDIEKIQIIKEPFYIESLKLANYKGEPVFLKEELSSYFIINFWASWCAPCRDEHPFLIKLSSEKKLKILGVNFKDKKKHAVLFLKDLGSPYSLLARDELGKQSVNFGIYGIPESILVNKDLIIIEKFIGPISDNDYNFIKKIVSKQ